MYKFISWNVNGLRAVAGKGFADIFEDLDADFFCLQETKLQEGQIDLEFLGYQSYWNYADKKGYSGTAIYTKHNPVSVTYGIGIDEHDHEGRVITLEMEDFYLVCVYVPNAQDGLKRLDYRMRWEDDFRAYLKGLSQKKGVVVCGDLNVAHKEIDLKNPKSNRQNPGFTDEERGQFTNLLEAGFTDTFRHFYPDQPDIYPYSFIIDGTKIADPQNVEIFPNEGYKASLADFKGPQPDYQDLQKVPHGKMTYTWYTSNAVGFDRPVCIYTPPGYDPADSKKYPVLYLIHGMTDTYETWFKVGKVNNILDNLIAKGLAEPMIVVMPYANPYPEMILRGQAKMYNPMDTQLTTKEFTESVVPFIEANYNVLTDADNRAIAGFSLGGRQTLACGLGNPDMFHYVCAFAPAIFGPEISANFENGTYAPAAEINEKMNLVWLSCGTSDFLYQSSLQLEKNFKDRGIEHKTMYPGGGHTWMNCRDYITAVAQLLFK